MAETLFYPVLPSNMPPHDKAAISQQGILSLLTNGMASYPADFLRDISTAKLLQNLLQSRKQGVWTNRDCGMTRYVSSAFNSGAQFYDMGQFIDSNSINQLVFQCGNEMYLYNLSAATTTSLGAMPTTSQDPLYAPFPTIRQFQPSVAGTAGVTVVTHPGANLAYVISGSSPTCVTFNGNGTSGGAIWCATAAPLPAKNYSAPALCEAFLNRMVYASWCANGLGTTGNVYDILITNAGYYNTITQNSTPVATDGVVMQVPAVLGRPTALKAVQLSNQNNQQALIIGCQYGVALITGQDATSFAMTTLTRQYGILSNRAFAQIDNDVMYLATDGIRCFSALIVNANLLTDTVSYGLQDYVQSFDQAYLNRAFVATNRSTKDVQFWVPTLSDGGASSNGVCNLGINFNYGDSSFGVNSIPSLNFAPSVRVGISIPCAIELPDPNNNNLYTMFSGGYNGVLYKHYSGNLTDGLANGGTPLPFNATFPLVAATSNVAQGATVRLITVICEGAVQTFQVNTIMMTRYANGTTLPTLDSATPITLGGSGTTQTELSEWTLGLSAFPGTFVQFFEHMPRGDGQFMNLVITGSDANHFIDLVGAHYLLSAGGLRM
jgi:hypothetical protein